MSDDKPAEKPTVQLAAVPDWAIELTKSVKSGFDEVRRDLETVKAEGQRTNLRLTRQEVRMDDVETRLANNSIRAKSTTQQDMEQDAQLAQERAAREALAVKVDDIAKTNEAQLAILARLDKIASNPTVKLILFALGTIATGYLASKGLK